MDLDHRELYRLPWSFSDNVIAWLEPTAKCNLACEGCYRANVDEHKSLEEIGKDLDVFARYRKFDGVSIAGGDPLAAPASRRHREDGGAARAGSRWSTPTASPSTSRCCAR